MPTSDKTASNTAAILGLSKDLTKAAGAKARANAWKLAAVAVTGLVLMRKKLRRLF